MRILNTLLCALGAVRADEVDENQLAIYTESGYIMDHSDYLFHFLEGDKSICSESIDFGIADENGDVCDFYVPYSEQLEGSQPLRRWAWLPELGHCVEFQWHGCSGNFNNFLTEKACIDHCNPCNQGFDRGHKCSKWERKYLHKARKRGDLTLDWYYDYDAGICRTLKSAVNPEDYYTHKQYKKEKYQGCGGNMNRYFSLEMCQAQCNCYLPKEKGSWRTDDNAHMCMNSYWEPEVTQSEAEYVAPRPASHKKDDVKKPFKVFYWDKDFVPPTPGGMTYIPGNKIVNSDDAVWVRDMYGPVNFSAPHYFMPLGKCRKTRYRGCSETRKYPDWAFPTRKMCNYKCKAVRSKRYISGFWLMRYVEEYQRTHLYNTDLYDYSDESMFSITFRGADDIQPGDFNDKEIDGETGIDEFIYSDTDNTDVSDVETVEEFEMAFGGGF